jgi:hypothetical protein
MDPIMMGAVVTVNALAVVALWLRLRWYVRREQARGRTLAELAGVLRAGGELDEQLPDGSRLKLTVTGVREERRSHG